MAVVGNYSQIYRPFLKSKTSIRQITVSISEVIVLLVFVQRMDVKSCKDIQISWKYPQRKKYLKIIGNFMRNIICRVCEQEADDIM